MGREVRKVAPDWEHPRDVSGYYVPLYPGAFGRPQNQHPDEPSTRPAECMPDWPDDIATHLMMYEDTSEGTPISPAFETPEELARWLTDNGASAFAEQAASYEGWLRVAGGGYAPSARFKVSADGVTAESGVEAMKGEPDHG